MVKLWVVFLLVFSVACFYSCEENYISYYKDNVDNLKSIKNKIIFDYDSIVKYNQNLLLGNGSICIWKNTKDGKFLPHYEINTFLMDNGEGSIQICNRGCILFKYDSEDRFGSIKLDLIKYCSNSPDNECESCTWGNKRDVINNIKLENEWYYEEVLQSWE